MAVNNAFAYHFAVKNADGVTIYYNVVTYGKEVEVPIKMKTMVIIVIAALLLYRKKSLTII